MVCTVRMYLTVYILRRFDTPEYVRYYECLAKLLYGVGFFYRQQIRNTLFLSSRCNQLRMFVINYCRVKTVDHTECKTNYIELFALLTLKISYVLSGCNC